jgi:hypothetical protein
MRAPDQAPDELPAGAAMEQPWNAPQGAGARGRLGTGRADLSRSSRRGPDAGRRSPGLEGARVKRPSLERVHWRAFSTCAGRLSGGSRAVGRKQQGEVAVPAQDKLPDLLSLFLPQHDPQAPGQAIGNAPQQAGGQAPGQAADKAAGAEAENPMLRWLFSGSFLGSGLDLASGLLAQGEMSRSDGTTSQKRDGSIGWKGGPTVSVGSSRKIEGDKDHAIEMAMRMGYADGHVTAERSTGGKMLDGEGAKLADSRTTSLKAGRDGAEVKGHATSSRKHGDDESQKTTDYGVGYGKDGPTGNLGHSVESTDGTTKHKQDAGARYGKDGLTISAGSSRHTKIDDDHQMGHSSRAGYKDGRASFEHSKESRIKDPDLTGVVDDEKTSTGVGFGKGGVEAERSHSHTTEVDGQSFTDETKHGYKDGKVSRKKSHSRTYKDEDGNEHTESKGHDVAVGKDGASVGINREKKTKDGGSSATSGTASVDWDKGEATVGGSHKATSKDGRSASVGGSATVDANGNLTGANVDAGLADKKSGTSVSVNGKYSVEAGKPEQQGGAWVVEWSRTIGGGISAGKKGGHGGVSVKGEASHKDYGTRVFHSKEEAEHFAKHAASLIPTDAPDPATAMGALALEVGESRGHTDGKSGGIGVNGQAGVATAGISADKGSHSGAMIERISPNLFQVTVSSGGSQGLSGQVGVGGVSAGKYTQSASSESVTVQFDLSTAEGRKSFEEYNRTHIVPPTGGRIVSRTEAEERRHGTRLNFGPAGSASFNSSTWDSTTWDKSGKTDVHGGTFDQNIVSNIPFMKERDNMGISLAGVEKNDSERSYVLQGRVDSMDGKDSRKHLAQITGMRYDSSDDQAQGGIKSSGKWRVDVNFTDEMAEKFMDEIGDEKVRAVSIFESKTDYRNELRKELKAARTSDDRMKAIARYVGEDGFEGKSLDVLRTVLFGQSNYGMDNHFLGNFDYDLKLEGDKNFRGVEGRLELEHKITGYQSLLAQGEASSATLVNPLGGEIEALRKQRAEIGNPKKYTDLPEELRAQQVGKLDVYIETLVGMRRQAAIAATKLQAGKPSSLEEGEQVDKELADAQHGKGDLKLAQLRKVRHKISASDAQIEVLQLYYKDVQQQAVQQVQHGSGSISRINQHKRQWHRINDAATAAHGVQAKVTAQMRSMDELRVQFVQALNRPEEALALGGALLAQVSSVESMLENATQSLQRQVDFFTGDLELAEEKPVYASIKTDSGYIDFDSKEEMEAYYRNQRAQQQQHH